MSSPAVSPITVTKTSEDAASKAPDATTASTFDAHRTDTYLYLDEPEKAEKLLAQREKEMPDDYNPPARLARALFEQGKAHAAEQAIDRALKLAPQGPRRVGLLGFKEKILVKQGKPIEAMLREELQLLESLPKPQRRPQLEAKIRDQLAKKK